MDCKHAYMQKKIPYVLCDKEAIPSGYDRKELFHAVCIHQAHCPTQNCHKLTPEWTSCIKLREIRAEKPQESAGVAFVADEGMNTTTKKAPQKRTRKPQSED